MSRRPPCPPGPRSAQAPQPPVAAVVRRGGWLSVLGVAVLVLVACKDDKSGGAVFDCEEEDGLRTCVAQVESSASGSYAFDVEVDDDHDAFLVGVRAESLVVFDTITQPDGVAALSYESLADSTELLTAGMLFLGRDESSLNWPVREEDGPLATGGWGVSLVTVDAEGYLQDNVGLEIWTRAKVDGDLSAGRFPVRVVLAAGIGDDPALLGATEDAVDVWAAVWGAHGIELDVVWEDDPIDPALPAVSAGDPELGRVADAGDGQRITLLVGESIGGASEVLGEAGAIPGTPWGGDYGLVAVAWLGHAGADGVFDTDDVRIFGETMAHEVGHFSGLFHPVELDLSYQDALTDTPSCDTLARCETLLGRNNLFPYPVCGLQGCQVQDELSDEQVGVLQRFTGMR